MLIRNLGEPGVFRLRVQFETIIADSLDGQSYTFPVHGELADWIGPGCHAICYLADNRLIIQKKVFAVQKE